MCIFSLWLIEYDGVLVLQGTCAMEEEESLEGDLAQHIAAVITATTLPLSTNKICQVTTLQIFNTFSLVLPAVIHSHSFHTQFGKTIELFVTILFHNLSTSFLFIISYSLCMQFVTHPHSLHPQAWSRLQEVWGKEGTGEEELYTSLAEMVSQLVALIHKAAELALITPQADPVKLAAQFKE